MNEIVEEFLQSTHRVSRRRIKAVRTFELGSSGSYFLLLIVSNSSLNCSKILVINELSVLPLTPAKTLVARIDHRVSSSLPPISTFSRRRNSAAV